MSLKVGCLPYAVGSMINLGKDDEDLVISSYYNDIMSHLLIKLQTCQPHTCSMFQCSLEGY